MLCLHGTNCKTYRETFAQYATPFVQPELWMGKHHRPLVHLDHRVLLVLLVWMEPAAPQGEIALELKLISMLSLLV